jgi:hypothetical protein
MFWIPGGTKLVPEFFGNHPLFGVIQGVGDEGDFIFY